VDANLNNPAAALIAASQPTAGNTSGGRKDIAVGPANAPAGESDFSNKIKSLQQDSVRETRASEAAGSGTEAPRKEPAAAPAAPEAPAAEAEAPTDTGSQERPGADGVQLTAPTEDGNPLPVTGKELPATEAIADNRSDAPTAQPDIETADESLVTADREAAAEPAGNSMPAVAAADLAQADSPLDQEPVQLPGADELSAQGAELTEPRPDRVPTATAAQIPNTPSTSDRDAPEPISAPATAASAISGAGTTTGTRGESAGMNFDGGANPQPGTPATAESPVPNAGNTQRVAFSAESPALVTPNVSGPAATAGATATLAELDTLAGTRALPAQAGQEQFARGLGERLLLMADGGLQSARIKISPENLGPLDIRIQVQDDATQVWFNANQSQTREILEQAMPRLRELLADQGMRLTDANVSGGDNSASGEARDDSQPPRDWRQPPPPTLDEQIAGRSLRQLLEARRLLDVYA